MEFIALILAILAAIWGVIKDSVQSSFSRWTPRHQKTVKNIILVTLLFGAALAGSIKWVKLEDNQAKSQIAQDSARAQLAREIEISTNQKRTIMALDSANKALDSVNYGIVQATGGIVLLHTLNSETNKAIVRIRKTSTDIISNLAKMQIGTYARVDSTLHAIHSVRDPVPNKIILGVQLRMPMASEFFEKYLAVKRRKPSIMTSFKEFADSIYLTGSNAERLISTSISPIGITNYLSYDAYIYRVYYDSMISMKHYFDKATISWNIKQVNGTDSLNAFDIDVEFEMNARNVINQNLVAFEVFQMNMLMFFGGELFYNSGQDKSARVVITYSNKRRTDFSCSYNSENISYTLTPAWFYR